MPAPIEIVEAEAMKLIPSERAALADKLWLSVHSKEEVDAAWDDEIARRIQQIDSGAVECLPWETVMAELSALEARSAQPARYFRINVLFPNSDSIKSTATTAVRLRTS